MRKRKLLIGTTVPGELNNFLHGEAPTLGSTPYPLRCLFDTKGTPFTPLVLTLEPPFICCECPVFKI